MAAPIMSTMTMSFSVTQSYLLRRMVTCTSGFCRSLSTTTHTLNGKENSTLSPKAEEIANNSYGKDRVGHIMQMYEDFVGLTEVKTAQGKVVEAETNFLNVQEDRRTLQQELTTIQSSLRTIGAELEKTHRTDPSYIDLVKKEHGILVVEKDMTNKLKTVDKLERDLFALLSACVRESHEKERGRAERTKYWSIIGSIVGAVIGITGSAVNNHKRLKEMRAIIHESGENSAEYKEIADKVLDRLVTHSPSHVMSTNETDSPVYDQMNFERLQNQAEIFFKDVNSKTTEIISNLEDVKKLAAVTQCSDSSQKVVYVGPEMKSLLQETELRLGESANKNLVISCVVTGGILTLGISLVSFFFKGS